MQLIKAKRGSFYGFARLLFLLFCFVYGFNPIQDESFSPVTSTNVGIRPQNFLTFSFNPFDRLV